MDRRAPTGALMGVANVGWLTKRRQRPGTLRRSTGDDLDHLGQFVATRKGVEAYLEPRTAVTEATVMLIAADGEWTRRRISGPDAARSFAKKHSIPVYDAGVVGYPARMREWNRRQKGAGASGETP